MTSTPASPPLDPISATLYALRHLDPVLGALAEVRETFAEGTRILWDVGISRYLKMRWDTTIDTIYGGDARAASDEMDENLSDYDVKETIHRACAVSSDPLMMEIIAHAMAVVTVDPQVPIPWWRDVEAIINALYKTTLVDA